MSSPPSASGFLLAALLSQLANSSESSSSSSGGPIERSLDAVIAEENWSFRRTRNGGFPIRISTPALRSDDDLRITTAFQVKESSREVDMEFSPVGCSAPQRMREKVIALFAICNSESPIKAGIVLDPTGDPVFKFTLKIGIGQDHDDRKGAIKRTLAIGVRETTQFVPAIRGILSHAFTPRQAYEVCEPPTIPSLPYRLCLGAGVCTMNAVGDSSSSEQAIAMCSDCSSHDRICSVCAVLCHRQAGHTVLTVISPLLTSGFGALLGGPTTTSKCQCLCEGRCDLATAGRARMGSQRHQARSGSSAASGPQIEVVDDEPDPRADTFSIFREYVEARLSRTCSVHEDTRVIEYRGKFEGKTFAFRIECRSKLQVRVEIKLRAELWGQSAFPMGRLDDIRAVIASASKACPRSEVHLSGDYDIAIVRSHTFPASTPRDSMRSCLLDDMLTGCCNDAAYVLPAFKLLLSDRSPEVVRDALLTDFRADPAVRECLELGKCTYQATGRKESRQQFFTCETCNPHPPRNGVVLGVCVVCRATCHEGHDLIPRSGPFYCDCGAGTFPGGSCCSGSAVLLRLSEPSRERPGPPPVDASSHQRHQREQSATLYTRACEALRTERCSYVATGKVPVPGKGQKMFVCMEERCVAGGEMNAGRPFCLSCKAKCHRAHRIMDLGRVNDFCHCGSGERQAGSAVAGDDNGANHCKCFGEEEPSPAPQGHQTGRGAGLRADLDGLRGHLADGAAAAAAGLADRAKDIATGNLAECVAGALGAARDLAPPLLSSIFDIMAKIADLAAAHRNVSANCVWFSERLSMLKITLEALQLTMTPSDVANAALGRLRDELQAAHEVVDTLLVREKGIFARARQMLRATSIQDRLKEHDGNITRAMHDLGLALQTDQRGDHRARADRQDEVLAQILDRLSMMTEQRSKFSPYGPDETDHALATGLEAVDDPASPTATEAAERVSSACPRDSAGPAFRRSVRLASRTASQHSQLWALARETESLARPAAAVAGGDDNSAGCRGNAVAEAAARNERRERGLHRLARVLEEEEVERHSSASSARSGSAASSRRASSRASSSVRSPLAALAPSQMPSGLRFSSPGTSWAGDSPPSSVGGASAASPSGPVPRHYTMITERELIFGELIGQGGFGQVWRGFYRGSEVAIKRIANPSEVQGAGGLQKLVDSFHRELTAMVRFPHARLVQCLGGNPEELLLVMTYYPRGSLFQCIHGRAQVPSHNISPDDSHQKLQICLDLVDAVSFLHHGKNYIIHQDIKTMNVLLDDSGRALLADFGLAKSRTTLETNGFTSQRTHQTRVNSGGGTVAYMAPEIFTDSHNPHRASDMYSLGVVLWEVCTSTFPWKGIADLKIPFKVSSGDASVLDTAPFPDWIPAELVEVIRSCVEVAWKKRISAKEAKLRLQSLRDMVESGALRPY